MRLSVLIASIPSRKQELNSLLNALFEQAFTLGEIVEILHDDSVAYNIGVKRNKLLKRATGDYIVFIDDDDEVSPEYISLILKAIETNPDCVGISGVITTNGCNMRTWHISKDYEYWHELYNVFYRTPNHISPVRRELALQAGFPEISFAEDAAYSQRLLPLLKTETKIPGTLYHYKYIEHK